MSKGYVVNNADVYLLPQNTDLNTVLTPGLYTGAGDIIVATFTNCPTTYSFTMWVYDTGGAKVQFLMDYIMNSSRGIYQRTTYTGVFSEWQKVLTDKNTTLATTTTNGLLSAADKTKIDALNPIMPGETWTANETIGVSGFISGGQQGLYFGIPISRPIMANKCRITNMYARGRCNGGYLAGTDNTPKNYLAGLKNGVTQPVCGVATGYGIWVALDRASSWGGQNNDVAFLEITSLSIYFYNV